MEFAREMKNRDASIQLMGWGDEAKDEEGFWAESLLEEAGELVDFVAIHMMNQSPVSSDSVLHGRAWMQNREQAWAELQDIHAKVAGKLDQAIRSVRTRSGGPRLAITEGHLSLRPRNTNLLLSEWLAGLYSARVMNLYERNADCVEVATLADFFGSRWTVNAVLLGGPGERPILMPAGTVAKWYRRSSGTHCINGPEETGALDMACSRDTTTLYIHVVNTDIDSKVTCKIQLDQAAAGQAKIRTIAPDRLDAYVDSRHPDTFEPTDMDVPVRNGSLQWTFLAASVTMMEIPLSGSEIASDDNLQSVSATR